MSEMEVAAPWRGQIRKGLLEFAILVHLNQGQVHGYRLIQALKEGGFMAADGGEATVYQALQRLAKQSVASSTWNTPSDNQRPRKVYAITSAGRIVLQELTREWLQLGVALKPLLEKP